METNISNLFELRMNTISLLVFSIITFLYSSVSISYDDSLNAAIHFYNQGKYAEAKKALDRTNIEKNPNGSYMMGAILLKESNLNEAVKWFQIAADNNLVEAYHALGSAYHQLWQRNYIDSYYVKSKEHYAKSTATGFQQAQTGLAQLEREYYDHKQEKKRKQIQLDKAEKKKVIAPKKSALTNKIARANTAQVNNIAKKVANSIAKDAPARINQHMTLLSVMFVSSTRTFFYSYETSGYITESSARSKITAGVCSNEIMYALAKKGILFRYEYSSPSGSKILSISVTSRDCY